MAEKSNIEWTDATWNPVLGCDKISPGCKGCYAIRTAWRLQHNPNPKVAKAFEGLTVIQGGQPNWTGRVNFIPERLKEPLRWKKSHRIFVNSQSDLFHDGVSEEQIDQVFAVMGLARQHTFQILTKRPARMLEQLLRLSRNIAPLEKAARAIGYTFKFGGVDGQQHSLLPFPLPNVWLGVSVENQQYADERIPLLLQTPAAVRWISAEPLLGPINFLQTIHPTAGSANILSGLYKGGDGNNYCTDRIINWVVAGGESGPGARPMHPDWARSLRDQCKAAGVPFLFKQHGEWVPLADREDLGEWYDSKAAHVARVALDGTRGNNVSLTREQLQGAAVMGKVGKKTAGRKLDGAEHSEYPVLAAGDRRA